MPKLLSLSRAARLAGVSPRKMSTVVWAIAGALAAGQAGARGVGDDGRGGAAAGEDRAGPILKCIGRDGCKAARVSCWRRRIWVWLPPALPRWKQRFSSAPWSSVTTCTR